MREIKRSAVVGKPPAEMFALISDIESYPEFVPWCTHARVQSRSQHEVVHRSLGVRQGALHGEFTTRNTLDPDRSIVMSLVSGPFRSLEGEWRLEPMDGNGCLVELAMRFALRNPFTAMLLEPLFAGSVGTLVQAFVARARSK